MHTLQLRTLLGRVAFAALLPLAITGCDDPTPSTSGGGTDTDPDDDTTDTATVTATATVTDTTPTTATMTDTTPDTDTESDTTPDTDTESDTETTATETTDTETTDTVTDTETGDTETTDTEGDTDADTDADTDSTTTGAGDCIVVTPDAVLQSESAQFYFNVGDYGVGAAADDQFRIEFWGTAPGTFDLAGAPNDNYETCGECIRFYEDAGVTGPFYFDDPQFFQSEGTLTLSADSDLAAGQASIDLTGVVLTEVSFAPDTIISIPVVDGRCIEIADGTYATPEPAPDGWNCSDPSYEDGAVCDCGCGIADPDCADADATTCDECNSAGSCGETYDTCDVIVADDNTACSIPAGWTCDLVAYGDGATCDCGCGIVDSDCADALVATCASCNGAGSCAEDEADCSTIDVDDNSTCDPTLLGWTCPVGFYGADDGCDCGCGAPDPDCGGDTTLAICDFCANTNSCSTMVCEGNIEIDPANNDVCL